MRVLLVSDYATPTGGAELMILALRDALRQRGHDARLLASSARPLNMPSQADYECFGISSAIRGLAQVANPSAYWRLKRILAEFRPDVVHVRLFLSQLSPLILPLLVDVPAIYHVAWYRCICPIGTKLLPNLTSCWEPAGMACLRNGCFPAYAWPSAMLQLKLWRHWAHAFNAFIANSAATKRRLEAEGIQPVEVIWNGVPVSPPAGELSPLPTVVFAGRLVYEKGAADLIEAFVDVRARVPGAKLLMAGDGPERPRLESQINGLGVQSSVTLLGHISRQEMERRFAGAWVQVAPSRWEEPFGLTAAESMMRGTAVIASNTGGLAEFVRHNDTGLLVPPQDPRALAEALGSVLRNPELARRLGLAGRTFALQNLTMDTFVDRFIELYELLCQSKS